MLEPADSLNKRIHSIDFLRGIIMIIMALDHVRDFFHISAMTADPTDPATTTPVLFFTRWITHFCAPVFVLLAGISAYLAGRKKTKKDLSLFLIKRGLWLIIFELVIFSFLFTFDPTYHAVFLQVLWVTGISMILLAILIYLPVPFLIMIGIVLIAGHNLLDRYNASSMSEVPIGYGILHQQFLKQYMPGYFIGGFYPLLPWPGIMIIGYCLGTLFATDYDAAKRRKYLFNIGLLTTILFFLLRAVNLYGDLVPWKSQQNFTATVLSFFNLTKYPPSLLFCCMTIGPALMLLAKLENVKAGWQKIPIVFGSVPLFYFGLHFFVIHLLCTIVFFASGYHFSQALGSMILFRPNDFGFSLGVVYLIWMAVVAGVYPICKKYSRYKATHHKWWLPYL